MERTKSTRRDRERLSAIRILYDAAMRAVVQRVAEAWLDVVEAGESRRVASIGRGLVVLVGAVQGDGDADAMWTAGKVAGLRIFQDAAGKMNLALGDVQGSVLLVPNFTLAGDARHGRRPSFDRALAPSEALALFDKVAGLLRRDGVPTQTGVFGADMRVGLVNDGPVTLVLDSRE